MEVKGFAVAVRSSERADRNQLLPNFLTPIWRRGNETLSTTLGAERELPIDRNGQANSNCVKRTSLENMINTKADTLEEVLLLNGRAPCSTIRSFPHASVFMLLYLSSLPSQGQNFATDTDGERIIPSTTLCRPTSSPRHARSFGSMDTSDSHRARVVS